MTAPSTTVSAEQRDAVLRLSIARFRPEDEVHSLVQECFFAHPRTVVAARFRREFVTLLPPHLQLTLPVSSGPLAVGSRLIATPQYLTRPQVAVEITAFDDDRVAYAYLDGSPFRGGNTVQFRDERGGSVANVTLRYQVVGVTTAIGWYLLGGARFHRHLIAEGFRTLDRLLSSEQKGAPDVRDAQQR
jgi:hypothetical protein